MARFYYRKVTQRPEITADDLRSLLEARRGSMGQYKFDGSWISQHGVRAGGHEPNVPDMVFALLHRFDVLDAGGALYDKRNIALTLRAMADVLDEDIEG